MNKSKWAYYFMAPFFLLYLAFNLFPLLFGVYISFNDWNGFGEMTFVGLENYRRLFTTDNIFAKSVLNSFVVMIKILIPVQLVGLTLAALINYNVVLFGKTFLRNTLFLPYMTVPVAIGLIFANLFDTQAGLLNHLLTASGLLSQGIPWLERPEYATFLVALTNYWKHCGYVSFIYLAGMQGIPRELFEAAKIDGAGTVKAFLRVVVPNLMPIIKFQVTLGIMGGLKLFEEPLMLYNGSYSGGPGNAAKTMNLVFVEDSFVLGQYGYGAAVGYVMFLIVVAASLLYFMLLAKGRREEGR